MYDDKALIKHNRWIVAQEYELQHWSKYSESIAWYKQYSDEIVKATSPFIEINKTTVILEIGSGAAGGITYLKSNNKYAIDPLEEFYSKNKLWINNRDKNVKYIQGKGENLPFENKFFDLIVLDNVLDHCENPITVLDEINRVLKFGGIIFFRQNVYNQWGKLIRSLMEIFTIDKGHPFTFMKKTLSLYIKERNWQIQRIYEIGYCRTWIENLNNISIKGIIQTILFVIRNRTLFILQKN